MLSLWQELKARANNQVRLISGAGAPTSGTSGTGVGDCGPGSTYTDITNKNLYINTNTAASPTWTLVASQVPANTITSGMMDPTVIKTATVLLTNAQIKAIRATPITIVAAPGAGFFVYPIECIIELVYGGNNAFTSAAGDNLALKWKDGTTAAIQQGGLQAFLQGTASAFNKFVDPATTADINVAKTNVDNQPLVMHNISASEIAGNAGADNTINVILKYAVHPTL